MRALRVPPVRFTPDDHAIMTSAPPLLADFPRRTFEKLRYSDTDRQGHVNNAVFSTMLETGRVEILCDPARPLYAEGCAFVIASLRAPNIVKRAMRCHDFRSGLGERRAA